MTFEQLKKLAGQPRGREPAPAGSEVRTVVQAAGFAGATYASASTTVGRDRLPPGIVAIVGDPDRLRLVICEMCDFVQCGNRVAAGRFGVVYRVVDAGERDAFNWHVQRVCDDVNASLGNLEGFRHVIDIDHVTHIHNGHTDAATESSRGHVAVSTQDFLRVPDIIDPRNSFECGLTKGAQRIAYRKRYDDGHLVAVEEVRAGRRELVLKTLYKHK